MKQGGWLGAGWLLQGQWLPSLAAAAGEPIATGIIGCGDRGKGLMSVMKELPQQFSMVSVCDLLDFRLREAEKLVTNLKTCKDYLQLLDDPQVKAVVIAVPLHMHFEIASRALMAGKHVYLEKTMTYDIPQAEKLVKLFAQTQGQVLQVGHQYRYTPLYFKVKEMIEKGYLGKVSQIDCRWDRNWNWRRPVPDPSLERKINWRMYKEYSGGLPAELLSHQIDFINWAFSTHPDEIFGTGGIDTFKDGRETDDNVQVMLRYRREGMIGNFGATCGNSRDGYLFKLKGTRGTVSLLVNEGVFYPEPDTRKELETVDGVTGATKITWNKDGGIPILSGPTRDGSWYALNDFYQAIVQKRSPVSNVWTGATTAVCVHLANRAIDNHTVETWKPAYDFTQDHKR